MYHKEFPFGKTVWIWRLAQCLGGDIDAIIAQCKKYDLSGVFIKNGDGANLWTQLNKDVVRQFQDAGIKVYAWSYSYGKDPTGEANVAIHNLDLGVNGFVFDAEAEYRDVVNNTQAAETMLQAVRARHPDAFLAYTPLAIIDFHTKFPYVTFGKYCDAVMPQVYYGMWTKTGQSPQRGILWMYDNWSRWQQNWVESGSAESVKPIIPIAQAFDDYTVTPPYVLKPSDIREFVTTVKDYQAVSFYSFQHIERTDCWEAIRDAKVELPTDTDRVEDVQEPAAEPVVPAVFEEVHASAEPPADVTVIEPAAPVQGNSYTEVINGVSVTVVEPAEEVEVVVPDLREAAPEAVEQPHVAPGDKPQKVELSPEAPTNIAMKGEKTTVTFKPSKDGSKMEVIVHSKKTHREYFMEFVRYVVALLQRKK
jgi:hypothetical protein